MQSTADAVHDVSIVTPSDIDNKGLPIPAYLVLVI